MSVVTVACSFPNGLRMRIFEMIDAFEQSPTGPRSIKRARQVGGTVEIAGPREFRGVDLQVPPRSLPRLQGKFAITEGVDEAFWQKWLAQNADLDLVRNGLIFACPSEKKDHVGGKAKDHKDVRSGFEPLDMTPDAKGRATDPRIPRGLPGRLEGISTAPESNQP